MKALKLVLGLGCAALTSGAQAQVILNIDLSDLNAVTFTATSAHAANDASVQSLVGVTLMNFFTSPTFAPQIPEGINAVRINGSGAGLGANGSSHYVDTYYSTGENGTYTGKHLNLTAGLELTSLWLFGTTAAGFTGSSSANFSQIPVEALPGANQTGDIRVGSFTSDFSPPTTVIGQWQIVAGATTPVPEPASVAVVAGLALGGFAFARRRMQQA